MARMARHERILRARIEALEEQIKGARARLDPIAQELAYYSGRRGLLQSVIDEAEAEKASAANGGEVDEEGPADD